MKIKRGVYTAYENVRPAYGAGNVISILSGSGNLSTVGSCTIKVGGEREIRTLVTVLELTRFRIVRLQPLGHLSAILNAKGIRGLAP
jgi:hypothetical protein